MIIIDTDIIIYCLSGKEEFINKLGVLQQKTRLFISIITQIELISFPHLTPEDLIKIDKFLHDFLIIPLDSTLVHISGYLRRTYGLKLGDSIIAATSLYYHAPLYTNNLKDFRRIKELKIIS